MRHYLFVFLLFALSGTSVFAGNPQVSFETNRGNFTIELYPEKAPKTVENFIAYVNSGFYKETIFHRVINNFMIQGGGFTASMEEKETRAPIINESNNGLNNEAGTIAMARTSEPNSATSQFFINLENNQFLNYRDPNPQLIGYCVFGRVTTGIEVIRNIGKTPTANVGPYGDVPRSPVIIHQVKLIK
ncbi:MAG: peptidylprolyl isomerase [Betaproteobacteria bacterium HGW-Betaproteobacteria-22]|nr:MAG: peptidylprolyl isomerase [Betaproteobacteria bacterium HGW-Betaproteobacteria-22]